MRLLFFAAAQKPALIHSSFGINGTIIMTAGQNLTNLITLFCMDDSTNGMHLIIK